MTLPPRTHILLAGLLWSALLFAAPPAANAGLILAAPTYMGLNSRLVGFWTFDGNDIAGNLAYDRSGQGITGTLTSGPKRTIGKIGQALDFDGVASYVDTPIASVLNNLGPLTYSAWINPRSFGGGGLARIIAKADSKELQLNDTTPNGLEFSVGLDTTLIALTTANSITTGKWQHVVVTWDGSVNRSGVSFYVDGQLISQSGGQDGSGTINDFDNLPLLIGDRADGTRVSDGKIDDVRIYNRAISPDEIKRLYKIGATAKLGAPNSSGSLSSGLVGWWTMDGKDTARNNSGILTVLDKSGNGNKGTSASAATAPVITHGKIGQTVSFDGTNDAIDIGDPASLRNLNFKTISAWIYPRTKGPDDHGVILERRNGANNGWLFSFCDDDLSGESCNDAKTLIYQHGFSTAAGKWTAGPNRIALNTWSHVAVTFASSTSAEDPTFYINGVAVAFTQQQAPSGIPTVDNDDITMGSRGAGDYTYDGSMDDVRIYTRVLSDVEIKRLYKMGSTLKQGVANSTGSLSSGLVGHWTFDGKNMSFDSSGKAAAYDISGNGNTASSSNAATAPVRSLGKLGQAVTFDGSNDRLLAGDSNSLDITGGGCIAAWYKLDPAGLGTFRAFASKGTQGSDELHNYHWEFLDGNNLMCNVGDGALNASDITTSATFTNTDWHHIVCTWTGSRFTIYLDGVFLEDGAQSVTPAGNTDRLQIGDWGGGGDNFQGLMDDLRIYNRALTRDEIKRLYNMGR